MSTVLGIILLLIIPLVFHLSCFKSKKFQDILASLIIGNFILITYIILLSIFHIFYGYLALILSIITAFVLGKIIKLRFKSNDIKFNSIIIAILFGIFIKIIQNITSFLIVGDSHVRYLPWARIISEQHYIPAVYNENLSYYIIHYPPFLQGILANLFSVINSSDSVIASIPILFSALTIFLLINWAYEFKNKFTYIFVILSLFLSYRYIMLSQMAITEPILLFFATAGFYFLFKYIKERKISLLVLLALSFSLLVLTKWSGLLISFIVFLALIYKSKDMKERYKIFIIYFLVNIPIIYWMIRNFYYFSNPFHPILANLFDAKWNISKYMPSVPESRQVNLFKELFLKFPASIFALFYMFKKRASFNVRFILITIILFTIFIVLHQEKAWIRYQAPFFGIIALFSGLFLATLYNSKIFDFLKSKRKIILQISSILFIILILLTIQFNLSSRLFPKQDLGQQLDVLNYLQENEENKVSILTQGSWVLSWYGNYETITPSNNFRLIEDNREIIEYDKDADYYYNIFKKYNIKYVYDSSSYIKNPKYTPIFEDDPYYYQYVNLNITNNIFNSIMSDNRFELVLQNDGDRLWKVK